MADGKLLTIFVPEDRSDIGGNWPSDKVDVAVLPASSFQEPICEGLLRLISDIDSEYFAFCGSAEPATDSLLMAARFAQARKCDVVRGLALATNHSGTVGIRGLDLLTAASTRTGTLQELPALLLDLRLDSLVIRKSLLRDICSGEGASTLFSASDLAARAILMANVLGRVPLVVAGEDDPSGDESPWPNRKIEIETLPNVRDGSCRALLEAAIVFRENPSDAEVPKAGSARRRLGKLPRELSAVLSADEKFLVLAAVPDEVYQLHERLSAGPGPVIALRLLRQLVLEDAAFEPWLQAALAQVVDIDVVELWRASPVDACVLCCIKGGRADLAAKAAQGEFDPGIVQLLDAQLLGQALSSLYREHSLLNRDWLSHRLGAWHRQIELAKTLRQRPPLRADAHAKQKLRRLHDVKQQLEDQLAAAKRELMRARLPVPEDASGSDSDSAPNVEQLEATVQELEQKLATARKETFRARKHGSTGGGADLSAEIERAKRQVEQRLTATRKQLFRARRENFKLKKAVAERKAERKAENATPQGTVAGPMEGDAGLRETGTRMKSFARARRKARKGADAAGKAERREVVTKQNDAPAAANDAGMEQSGAGGGVRPALALARKRLDKAYRDIQRKDAEAAQLRAALSALGTNPANHGAAPANADNTGEVRAELPDAGRRNPKPKRWADVKKCLAEASKDIQRKNAETAELRAALSALEAKLGLAPRDSV